jgi:Tol biopolymer transport system component
MSTIRYVVLSAATSVAAFACAPAAPPADDSGSPGATVNAVLVPADSGETHFGTVTQLTFAGENAEAYFSRGGDMLIFQSTRDGRGCDQQYVMQTDGGGLRRVSNGEGKTTCGYFYDGDQRILYSSTHAADSACPARPDPSRGYVWGLDAFEIYTARSDGSDLQRLTNWNAYTAEATVSPDGRTIVFTSTKDGDLEIYTMGVDGSNVRRLTNAPGYDGGPFFSPDGSKIVYRAYHPTDSTELATYRDLLGRNMVRPSRMEVWIMNADGSGQRQVTSLGGANFAPFFTPDGERIIFSSNHQNPRSRNFDLYLVNLDGSGLEQVTTNPEFDGFPMFSPDGTKLIWASNRHAAKPTDTNLFVAEWR